MGRKRIRPVKPSPSKCRAQGFGTSKRAAERRDCLMYEECLTSAAMKNKEAVPCAKCQSFLPKTK